jgi:DNA-binding GntR family transcriptional regulator
MTDYPPELADGPHDDLVSIAHGRLRDAILRHELTFGEPVSQVQLAREMGISRSPLREALKMLEREGLVVAEPNRRVRIAGVSVADLEQLYAMRITLEAFAASVTAIRLSDGEVATLRDSVDAMDECVKAADNEGWHAPHRAFHRGLLQHSGARIIATADQLSDHSDRYRRIYLEQPTSYVRGAEEHHAILGACSRRDAADVATRLADHLARTALTVLAQIDPGHESTLLSLAVRSARAAAGQKAPSITATRPPRDSNRKDVR